MRQVMFAMNISIDSCYDHTHFSPNEDLMDYFTQLMHNTGVIVYGRKTYELMIPFWPEVAKTKSGTPDDIAFAEAITPIEKIVLSRKRLFENFLVPEKLNFKLEHTQLFKSGAIALHYQKTE